MSESSRTFAIDVSLDLIDEVMGEYFNRQMFKRKVKVVDSKPSSSGYMFQLEHVEVEKGKKDIPESELVDILHYPKVQNEPYGATRIEPPEQPTYRVEYTPPAVEVSPIRDSNGRFVRKGK